MDWLFSLGIFFTIIAVMITVMIRRALQIKKLAQEGSLGKATITQKKRGQKGRTRLHYEFQAPTGEIIKKHSLVSEKIYEESQVGQELEVYYLLNNPKVIAPKYMVDQAREAMSKSGIGSL